MALVRVLTPPAAAYTVTTAPIDSSCGSVWASAASSWVFTGPTTSDGSELPMALMISFPGLATPSQLAMKPLRATTKMANGKVANMNR